MMLLRNRSSLDLVAHAAVLLPALVLGAASASAQGLESYFTPVPHTQVDTDPTDGSQASALSRYAAPGVRLGSIMIRPELNESVGYNSNVDGRTNGKGSTTVLSHGAVRAASDWSRNSLLIQTSVDDHRFLNQARQNYTDWNASIAGSIDVGHDAIVASYSHSNANDLPGSINAVTFVQPVPIRIDAARLGYLATQLGRFTVGPELRVTHYKSDDFNADGVIISQAYRERTALQPGVTVRYQLAPQRDLLFVVQGTHLAYQTGPQGLPKRDSDGIAVLGGLDYEAPGANLRVRALAGVQTRQYDSSVYTNQTAPTLELSATWTPNRLTTVALTGRRQLDDAANDNVAAYTNTAFRLNVDHELRRNVTLHSFAEVQLGEYQSTKIRTTSIIQDTSGTTQTLFGFGAGATWQLNRNVGLGLDYSLAKRESNSALNSYVSNIGLLTFKLRL